MAEDSSPAHGSAESVPPDNSACRIPTWHILFVTAYAFTAILLFGSHVTHETSQYSRVFSTAPQEDVGPVTVPLDLAKAMGNLVRLFFNLAVIHFVTCALLLILFMIAADNRETALIRCWDTGKFFAGAFAGVAVGIAGLMAWIVLTRQ
jgi:hypothetical protein